MWPKGHIKKGLDLYNVKDLICLKDGPRGPSFFMKTLHFNFSVKLYLFISFFFCVIIIYLINLKNESEDTDNHLTPKISSVITTPKVNLKPHAIINAEKVPTDLVNSNLETNSPTMIQNVEEDSSESQAVIPAVFSQLLSTLPLNEDQQNGVRLAAKHFVERVGPAPLWHADPAYALRWDTARQEADQELRSVLGWDLYNALSESIVKGFTSLENSNQTMVTQ